MAALGSKDDPNRRRYDTINDKEKSKIKSCSVMCYRQLGTKYNCKL